MHDKKVKGDIGVVKIIAKLTELGWNIGIPITEHAHYDLFAEKQGIVKRVQVKYVSLSGRQIRVNIRSSWSDKNGTHKRNRTAGDYDVLAVYCPDTDRCYFLSEAAMGGVGRSITLHLERAACAKHVADDFTAL